MVNIDRSDPHSLPLLCRLCLAAHAQKLVQPAWQDFNTFKFLPCNFSMFTCLILESDITWIPSTMGPDSLPKATTTEGLRLQLQMWMANNLGCQLVHEWTLSVGYEVEVWLSCNRFKSQINLKKDTWVNHCHMWGCNPVRLPSGIPLRNHQVFYRRYLLYAKVNAHSTSKSPIWLDFLKFGAGWNHLGQSCSKLPYFLRAFVARSPLFLLDQLWIQSLFFPESWTSETPKHDGYISSKGESVWIPF